MTLTPEEDASQLFEKAEKHNRSALARLITHIESGDKVSTALNKLLVQPNQTSHILGITGPPGAGKSTLLSKLVSEMCTYGAKIAVLVVDPSSPFSGGAILGDRLRLEGLSNHKQIYIRSLATRGRLGGTTSALPKIIRLLEKTGWTHIIIETVGVGQSELDIASIADTTCVVVNPGWGDVIQANKAGLMETANIFVINKADRDGVAETRLDLEQVIGGARRTNWTIPVCETIATTSAGVSDLTRLIKTHLHHLEQVNGRTQTQSNRLCHEVRLELQAGCDRVFEKWRASAEFDNDVNALLVGEKSLSEMIRLLLIAAKDD